MKYRLNTGGIPLKDYFETLKIIGEGAHHKVYQHPTSKNVVIKKGKYIINHYKTFITNANIFPIVYEMIDCNNQEETYIVIEKLNTYKLKKEWNILFSQFDDVSVYYFFKFNHIRGYHVLNDKINNLNNKQKTFLEKISNVIKLSKMNDLHIRNFGLTADGKIKVLDI